MENCHPVQVDSVIGALHIGLRGGKLLLRMASQFFKLLLVIYSKDFKTKIPTQRNLIDYFDIEIYLAIVKILIF